MMRVLVCGGRTYASKARVFAVLDLIHARIAISCLIQGGASGADDLARLWARERGVPGEEYRAEWGLYGKRAGMMRNLNMLDVGQPDLTVAFPGGSGTEDMVARSRVRNVLVIKVPK